MLSYCAHVATRNASESGRSSTFSPLTVDKQDHKMNDVLKSPFPWFGGKSKVAHLVWDRFGSVRNYVEPFAGSLAVLLGRATEPFVETVNDLDCYLANFWRAIQADPGTVAAWADWPVNEADLHARHLWLVNRTEFRELMKTDPDYYDSKIAGWWVWGISQWIGNGWCQRPKWTGRTGAGGHSRGIHTSRKRPILGGHASPGGVHRQLPQLGGDSGAAGRGIHATGVHRKKPHMDRGGKGVLGKRVWNVRPYLAEPQGRFGQGIQGRAGVETPGIYDWFALLSERLRRVRVCCGDWKRVLGPAATTTIGLTGVFLDPPYSVEDRDDVYNEESRDIAKEVAAWAIEHGSNRELRIALCGYEDEHKMPDTWECMHWKTGGGYGSAANSQGRRNSARERIWFSPACLRPGLF